MTRKSTAEMADQMADRYRWGLILLTILLAVVAISALWVLVYNNNWGNGDFVAYWSATYLLSQGQDIYDIKNMRFIQDNLIQTQLDFVVMVWNPPTLFALLLPLALLPYQVARATWFIINMMILFSACMLLGKIYFPSRPRLYLIFCLLAAFFPPVLSAFVMGQVTFLTLLGVAACLFFMGQRKWFWAGFSLILFTIKPHIVFLPAVYLLVYFIFYKKWRALIGVLLGSLLMVSVLFALRPSLINDLLGLFANAPTNWLTPTIGGLLDYLQITSLARYLILLFIPLTVFLALRTDLQPERAVPLLIVLTVPFSFFGWSYDHSILLMPLAYLFGRMSQPYSAAIRRAFGISIVFMLAANMIQRMFTRNDLFHFWFPLAVGIIFFLFDFLADREQRYLLKDTPLNG